MIEDKIHLIKKIFNNDEIRTVWDSKEEKYYIDNSNNYDKDTLLQMYKHISKEKKLLFDNLNAITSGIIGGFVVEIIKDFDKIGVEDNLDAEINKRDSLEEKSKLFKEGDIYKMHTYKDSILDTEGAYVLYPGDVTKRFYESNTVIPSVGAFCLTPGEDDSEEDELEIFIKQVVKKFLD